MGEKDAKYMHEIERLQATLAQARDYVAEAQRYLAVTEPQTLSDLGPSATAIIRHLAALLEKGEE